MIFQPKKDAKKASVTTVLLFAAGGTMYFTGEFVSGFRMFFQFSALALIALGIYLMSRYLLTDHRYVISDIERRGDEVAFSVVRVTGNRENVMASFDFADIYAFEQIGLKEFETKHGRVNKVYNYCQNFRPEAPYRMGISFNGMKIVLVIEADEALAQEIRARLTENTDV